MIAYTSDFIPRSVYAYVYSETNDLRGYIDSSLSEFNTSDYIEGMGGDGSVIPVPATCQYRGYRNGPNHKDPYGFSPQYWHVFAARLAFVVVFEHVVSLTIFFPQNIKFTIIINNLLKFRIFFFFACILQKCK